MKEVVLNNIKPGAESTAEYKDNAADIRFFRVLLTPVMANGSVGPSVVRDVVPVLTTGDI